MPDLSLVQPAQPSALEELVGYFLDDRIAAGLSPRTIGNDYRPRLERVFLPWARENAILEPAQLDQRTVNRFSTHLHAVGGPKGPLAPHSVSTYTKTVNAFLASVGIGSENRGADGVVHC